MAKRFIDTNYFNDPFILSLRPDDKLIYVYFLTICDHAGIFELNAVLGNFHLNCRNYIERVIKFTKNYPDKLIQLDNSNFLLMSFCKRQYPNGVNTNVRQISGAISILEKWNIEIINNETFTLRINNSYERVKNSYGNGNGNGNNTLEKDKNINIEEKETWRTNYDIFFKECREACLKLYKDPEYIKEQQKLNPGVDIRLTLEKAFKNYWGTEAGWQNKKSKKAKNPDWKRTFTTALTSKMNIVYIQKGEINTHIYKKDKPETTYPGKFSDRSSEVKSVGDILKTLKTR